MRANVTDQIGAVWSDCVFDKLPEDVLTIAKLCVLDNLGCALACYDQPIVKIVAAELFSSELNGAVDLLPGSFSDAKPSDRAMLHAVAAHAVDFDDTFVPAKAAHAGAVIIGTALAIAGQQSVNGKQLLEAVVAGYEVAARVGELLDDKHYLNGFHPTCTTAIFGAAACASKLLGLDQQQMQAAMGVAATQASGLKCVFGSMAKPFNAGNAAASGTLAARLVANGFTAPVDALEADKGYLDMFLGKPEEQREVAPLSAFRIRENLFKSHAACHATHPLIEAIHLLKEKGLQADKIKKFEVGVPELSIKTASVVTPKTGLECKFSFNQVAACALSGLSTASEATYSDEVLANDSINALRERVSVSAVEGLPQTQIEIAFELEDGSSAKENFDFQKLLGNIVESGPSIESKFVANVEPGLGVTAAQSLCASIQSLEQADDSLQFLAIAASAA